MPDSDSLLARRGAHWTFDGQAFLECLRRIHSTGEASVPAFQHGVGDPEPDKIIVQPSHKVILIEGNYILYGRFWLKTDSCSSLHFGGAIFSMELCRLVGRLSSILRVWCALFTRLRN